MRFINTEVLLRNRRVFARARDVDFVAAGRLVDDILVYFGENGAELIEPERVKNMVASLVDRLYHARYFARLSAGGNNAAPAPEIDHAEQAYIDHVETMYSFARSIHRFVRHGLLIDSFVREHPDVSYELKAYLGAIRKSDANLIYNSLRGLRERMNVYGHFMNHPRAAAVEAPAEAS